MGMLMRRHRKARAKGPAPKPRRSRKPKPEAPKPEAPKGTSLEGGDYDALSDEQVLEAYATTFPEGEATERDAQVTELRAVNVERDSFTEDPESE